MATNTHRSLTHWALIITVLAILLYAPFLSNALVFDDHNLISNSDVLNYAETPFDLRPRTFPYFSLGLVQVLFGSIEAHRSVSLVLHILCAGMLFVVLNALLEQALKNSDISLTRERDAFLKARSISFIGAIWFVINPVAVYGAAYLAERTILFATLFSLLSIWYYRRAFAENRMNDIIVAELFYSLAVFSKEHVVMLPFASLPLTILYEKNFRPDIKKALLYVLLCTPAALIAVYNARNVVAHGYEPLFSNLVTFQAEGIPFLGKSWGPWFVSVCTQTNLFFNYLTYWILPDIRSMSIDMRIDIKGMWSSWWLFPKVALFFICPFISLLFLKRRGLTALFGCGLLYCWLLFATELSTVRFQEIFVFYRSYLWAPGYAMMLVSVISALPWRTVAATSAPLLIVFFGLAHDRLVSLASEKKVWQDAVLKIPSESVPGSDRIFYNLGLQAFKEKQYELALADFDKAIKRNPSFYIYYYQRGVAFYQLQEFSKAQKDFDQAFRLNSHYGPTLYGLGMMYEQRGCIEEAKHVYSMSVNLGVPLATIRLNALAKKIGNVSLDKSIAPTSNCK